ncbi:CPBP family intramembrane metalloprotease [Rubrobacter tropicus]|uniref:CPBP family intramembrane metalloprotease n=1 Tax=Rubrobacter tropicus TaxID=2653851 RepID=A0A6G8QAD8_9ACTN|nr:CPBP family intramembrane glutamic endopeptidase [Rubrobacter tropicus]QIN83436.1 CPBP family intramembrane metalloprotease [Rubrobacter tropicus]
MRRFPERRPVVFCLLVTLALFALTALSRFSFPRAPVGNIKRLPQKAFETPTGLDRVIEDLKSPEVLFWGLAILLALALLLWTGLWREAGFNRPIVKNLRLLWFPLFVGALTLSGGVFVSGIDAFVSAFLVVLVAAFGQELLFRGLLWRALAPVGPVGATILTSLLAGALIFGRTFTDGPWPEAVRLTSLAVCSGFTYGALRWRTASIWPVILVHTVFALAVDVAALGTVTYQILIILSTVGFVLYGLFLLRNRAVRADGGLAGPKSPRVR